MAYENSQCIAAANLAVYKGAAWYWTGASDLKALKSGANSLLQWEAISDLSQDGINCYEPGAAYFGSDKKLKGISSFKKSFGEKLIPAHSSFLFSNELYAKGLRAVRSFRRNDSH